MLSLCITPFGSPVVPEVNGRYITWFASLLTGLCTAGPVTSPNGVAVVPHDRMTVEPAAMLRHLDSAGLSKYDMPEFILPLEEMPLTASGKVRKGELVREVEEGRLRPLPVRIRPASS